MCIYVGGSQPFFHSLALNNLVFLMFNQNLKQILLSHCFYGIQDHGQDTEDTSQL